ncbi:Pfs, NACHT and ankyrin domain protein, partial [Aureobasidium melanogenum]
METKKLSHDDYTVAWICPLKVEQIAALQMLDEKHQRLPQPEYDHNAYNLGSIYGHNVVIAGLPLAGNCFAATVVTQMRNTYPRLRFGLLVGIGGGVPTRTDEGAIRLGHIVVSQPVGQHSGAVQYDHGKAEASEFVRTGFLAPPPMVLLNAARELQVSRCSSSADPLISNLDRIDTTKRGLRNFKRPSADQDHLYEPEYIHLEKGESCKKCGCDSSKRVDRDVDDSDDDSTSETDDNWLVIHRGTIASGEVVMRDGLHRDALARDHKILCFEMEAAGALNDFPCLVIRGISDYSDSHKNDKWHGYAAAVAAAYARELFHHVPVEEVKQCKIAETDVREAVKTTQETAGYMLASRVKDWLRPPDASINLVNASKLRHSNTGRWFLESGRYKWLKSTYGARLWLRGMPGCGKTVLSSTIIEDLKLDRTAGTAIVYFFFSFSDESKQKLDYMLRSLIFQLAEWHRSSKEHLMQLFKGSRNGCEQPRTTALIKVLSQMLSELQDVTVVLDALDEAVEKPDLMRWITSPCNANCKFILTSRPERDIEESLVSWLGSHETITLEDEAVDADIKAYIYYRLETESRLSRWTTMHEEIVDVLVKKAAGMFRWVHCQIEELTKCLDKLAVRRVLQTLPKDLNETYDRILQDIPAARVSNAIKLLQLLTFTNRPLWVEEAVDAIATEPELEPPFDIENRILPPEAVVGYCSSLVKVTTVRPDISPTFMQLQLAHFSVQEYLLLNRLENPYHQFFEEKIANARISQICLAYLWKASEASRDLTRPAVFPFTTFATHSWPKHARIAGESDDITFKWTSKIFTTEHFKQYWLRDKRILERGVEPGPSLYYASLGGLERSVRSLLKNGADPNARGGWYGNALHAASVSGNTHIVQILLDQGARVNAKGRVFGSALQAAAQHIDVMRLLLDHGANSEGIEQGNKDIAELLLEDRASKDPTVERANSYRGLKHLLQAWDGQPKDRRGSRDHEN